MENTLFMTVQDIQDVLGVSRNYAYGLIRKLNKELAEKGYLVIRGRTMRSYFFEKIYDSSGALCKKE